MTDDFDPRHEQEARLIDGGAAYTSLQPVASIYDDAPDAPGGDGAHMARVRSHRGVPAGLTAAAIALVLIVVAGAGMFGGSRGGRASASGSPSPTGRPTSSPDSPPTATALAVTSIQIEPKLVADLSPDIVSAAILGPDGAAYVLDDITGCVYRVDLATGAPVAIVSIDQKVSEPNKIGKVGQPTLLATGGGDILVLDGYGILWRWRSAHGGTGRGVLSEVNIPDEKTWGHDAGAIGTYVVNPQLGLYNIYVAAPPHQQVFKYPPAADGGYPTAARANYLIRNQDLSAINDLYIDGDVYLVNGGAITKYQVGSLVAGWSPAKPRDRQVMPFYTHLAADSKTRGAGTFYAYDSANNRVVAFKKADGELVAQYVAPPKSSSLSNLTGMFVTTDANGGNPTLYWTDDGELLSASLDPRVQHGPSLTASSAPTL